MSGTRSVINWEIGQYYIHTYYVLRTTTSEPHPGEKIKTARVIIFEEPTHVYGGEPGI